MDYKRDCPMCHITKEYLSAQAFQAACRKNAVCRRCAATSSGFLDRFASDKNCGQKNAFFGKTHSDMTKRTLSLVDKTAYKTPEFSEKMKEVVRRGSDCHFWGTSLYEIWFSQFGREKADDKMRIASHKKSLANSGENNPMYGKPAPNGSGNGWKGWYQGWFFRSLRELNYVISVLEKDGSSWVSAESDKLAIPYRSWDGSERTYRADFFVDGRRLVEVKPFKLHKTPTVILKKEAAIRWCSDHGFEYNLLDPGPIAEQNVLQYYQEGKIAWTQHYEEKFRKLYLNNS